MAMRTTVRLDSQLLDDVKSRARREQTSVSRLLDSIVRAGLNVVDAKSAARGTHREPPANMGAPRVLLDNALELAACLEDHRIARLSAEDRKPQKTELRTED